MRRPFAVAASVLCACASVPRAGAPARAPEWVVPAETCLLSGRVYLDPELRPRSADDPLAKAECRQLRVRLDGDEGSAVRVEPEGHFAAGFGECHFQFAAVPRGQSTLGAEFELAPELKGQYLFRTAVPFNAVVCSDDSRTWNQTLELAITLPEVVAPPRE